MTSVAKVAIAKDRTGFDPEIVITVIPPKDVSEGKNQGINQDASCESRRMD